jgi:hypothetical protein
VTQDLEGFSVQGLARRRRANTPRASMQKRDTQLLLELGNLLAQGRLGNVHLGGRAREAAAFDDLRKVPQLPQFHMPLSQRPIIWSLVSSAEPHETIPPA